MATLEESLIFGSLFAGIGGFDLGFKRAGMRCAWSVEIDDRCNEVRAHHWPDVRQYKDVRDVGQHNLEPVDIICGGFPCQDLSVAGRRAGLAGERSGLWWEFHRIIEELSPRWAIIENVPGLLSSNKGRDMGTLVGALGQLGYGYAWATLDAQFFGVAQRRRRVFIVGCLGDWRGAPQVLFEPESGQRDSAPSRETGEDAARSITKSLGSGSPDDNRTQAGFYTTIRNLNDEAVNLTPALRDTSKGSGSEIIVQHALSGNNQRNDPDGEHFVVAQGGSENQRGEVRLTPYSYGISSGGGKPGQGYPAALVAPVYPTLRGQPNQGPGRMVDDSAAAGLVRRLTPLEAERLQGFPDTWTAVNGISDSARYRMLGNAVAVPVAVWIGKRITEVDYGIP